MEQQIRFEEAMQKLSEIVEKLEGGEGSLDEMIRLYEEGMSLVKSCETQLDAYEAKIDKLNETAEGAGNAE
ncbi:MAG: exodeoxyribonuclease VII small subunit [Christensenella sp.]|nr:exodeoxyribonuclease VII small subunit [Christensenella sp.]